MSSSRTARRDRAQQTRRFRVVALGVTLAVGVLALVGGLVLAHQASSETVPRQEASTVATVVPSSDTTVSVATTVAPTMTSMVEVPDVTGMTLTEATTVISAAGLCVERVESDRLASQAQGDERIVASMDPSPGRRVDPGSTVVLTVPADSSAKTAAAKPIVVCIDPGHQAKSDLGPEPIGPGATETKERVRGGTTGTTTRIPEYEIVLQISLNLKKRLEDAGVTVVMTRVNNDTNVSNAERAEIANDAGAALFVRVHCDGSTDAGACGVSTLYPGVNKWTGPIADDSKAAATSVQEAVVAATGASSRGIVPRTDQTGFNWSKVPAVTVECGFMTNAVEDRLLASPNYQDKLAQGMADGIIAFVKE